jgi:hypothetical protein
MIGSPCWTTESRLESQSLLSKSERPGCRLVAGPYLKNPAEDLDREERSLTAGNAEGLISGLGEVLMADSVRRLRHSNLDT